jgi:hypothetical protein
VDPGELETLLRLLREHGVTNYQTPELTLTIAAAPPAPPKHAPGPGDDAGEPTDGLPELDPEDGDPENLLVDIAAAIHAKNHPQPPGRVKRAS